MIVVVFFFFVDFALSVGDVCFRFVGCFGFSCF